MKKLKVVLFILILLLAAVTRFYRLSSIPASLNWDEVSHGYNAYSLLKTGKDQWGVSWPLFNFRAYGDYPMVLNLYLTIPAIKIFGLSAFSVRLPSALLGLLTVLTSYFLGKVIFRKQSYGLWLMFLASISPWLLLPSRAVFQSTIAQFFLVFGITLFFLAIRKQKSLFFLLSSLSWALSGYGYHNTRIVAPLLFIIAIFLYRKEMLSFYQKKKLATIVSLVIFCFLSLAQLINLFSPQSRARGKWVFLIDQGAINQINEARGVFSGNPFLARLLHNKVTYLVPQILRNFISYFNPKYLFFSGGDHYQFSVPGKGVLPSVGLPFFYLGLVFLVIALIKKRKDYWFLFSWLAVGLIPAVITKGEFQVVRAMSILPLPQILILLGLKQTSDFLKKKSKAKGQLVTVVFLASVLAVFFIWWKTFCGFYRTYYSWAWQYGYKEVVDYAKANYSRYEKIIFTKKYGEPHEFVLFWWPWEPAYYQQDSSKVWDYHADWYWVDAFDKFEFWNDWEVREKLEINPPAGGEKLKILLITSPGNWIDGGKLLTTIDSLSGDRVFEIVEY